MPTWPRSPNTSSPAEPSRHQNDNNKDMTKALSVVRSILFFLYMALTVIPWGAAV